MSDSAKHDGRAGSSRRDDEVEFDRVTWNLPSPRVEVRPPLERAEREWRLGLPASPSLRGLRATGSRLRG